MNIESIEKVRGLLYKLESAQKKLVQLHNTKSIHITINAAPRDAHMQFTTLSDLKDSYPINLIQSSLLQIIKGEILGIKQELSNLGVNIEDNNENG